MINLITSTFARYFALHFKSQSHKNEFLQISPIFTEVKTNFSKTHGNKELISTRITKAKPKCNKQNWNFLMQLLVLLLLNLIPEHLNLDVFGTIISRYFLVYVASVPRTAGYRENSFLYPYKKTGCH